MFRIRKHLILVVLGIIASTGSLCLGKVVGVADVVVDGVVLVSARTPDGYEVVAGVNLHLGTSTSRLGDAGDYPPQNADDFDFMTRAANDYPLTWVFGRIWRDTNGDQPDFFIFEAAGSREVTYFRALFPDGSMGEPLVVPTDAWLDTGVVAGQMIAGLAFSITDLKDTSGNDLPINAEIQGLVVGPLSGTSGNVDPVVIAAVMINEIARGPTPANGQTDVPRDVILGWTPGEFADKHDVYFETVFDDVNKASRTNPLGVLVRQNQDANSYDPAGLLDFGQTYYWRVDEVKAAPDYTIFKGNIWSFTVEPFAYTIAGENIIATASSVQQEGMGPENTINGSGLDASDLHSTDQTDMWLSRQGGPQPAWIQYEFDKVYNLHQMWVWNHNTGLEGLFGLGIKEATIEYSTDGTDWTVLNGVIEFAQAPGATDYAHNTEVDLAGAVAKYVKVTVNNNWGGHQQHGLSEVRFFYLSVQAREPKPALGATDVYPDVVLSWRAGREADTHDVYLSNSEQEVIDANASVATVSEPSYDAGTLDLGRAYYWRVDEVNGAETPATWQGEVWNFATAEYLVVDDFESYNDLDPTDPESNRIFNTWIDGYDSPTNGSVVGYSMSPFAEQTFVHDGHQAIPFSYDNTGTASVSEAVASIANLQSGGDWTRAGITTLTLYFHGNTDNTVDQMYVKVNGVKVVYGGDAVALARPLWTQWNIDLNSLGVNLQNVTQLAIGFGDPARTTPGGKGLVFFDDIRLYRLAPELPGEMIWLEAEAADTLGTSWRLYDDPAASGRKYIGSENEDGNHSSNPPGADWIASHNFTAAGGVYKVMLRVKTDSDSFWVRITGATNLTPGEDPGNAGTGWVRFNGMPTGRVWHWVDVFSSDHNDTVANWTLPAGPHTLEIAKREDGVWLDAILITDKLD